MLNEHFVSDQGRSRGAARRRSRLHDVRAGDHRIRRLADERLADARSEAVLRRHLLSADVAVGTPGVRRHPAGDRARLAGRAREGRRSSAEAIDERLSGAERAAVGLTVPGARRTSIATVDAVSARRSTRRRGGFGDAPKFPRPSELLFLLREHARNRRRTTRGDMVLRTLRAMALGGMRDHIGGGFHRYSVDGDWRVPHFEKMLYDQAQLVHRVHRGAQVSGDPFYAEVAEDTLLCVMREMTDAGGGFYSAEDADSIPPEEAGAARAQEGRRVLSLARRRDSTRCSATMRPIVRLRFGIEPDGNAPHDPQQEFTGKNLLYVAPVDRRHRRRQTGRRARRHRRRLQRARLMIVRERLEPAAPAARRQDSRRRGTG